MMMMFLGDVFLLLHDEACGFRDFVDGRCSSRTERVAEGPGLLNYERDCPVRNRCKICFSIPTSQLSSRPSSGDEQVCHHVKSK